MGFMIYCDNKGCGKSQEPLLDVASDDVYCVECNRTIKSVTFFTKRQMKALGQIKRNDKSQRAFAVKCNECKKEAPPELLKTGVLVCGHCASELKDLAKPYAQMLKSQLKAQQ